jgi:hypothetical protein
MTVDFSRSFVTFRIDTLKRPPVTASHEPPFSLNNARIQIECRCTITDRQTSESQWFVLGASCKTERVGVERDIWTTPNADFAPIFSAARFMHLKTYARCGLDVELYGQTGQRQSDRQHGLNAEAFDDVRLDVVDCEASELASTRSIIEATLSNRPLVARTTFGNSRYLAVIEYPIKTMNVNERDRIYQTDTGPVLFPDLECDWEEMIAGFELAYAAFNCPEWVEFLLRAPTSLTPKISVQHYSGPRRIDCENQVFVC